MTTYLVAGLVIALANLLPAFAPPTWSILVYFVFKEHMNPAGLVVLGVSCATLGRSGLALTFRKISSRLPRGYVTNLEQLGSRIRTDSKSTWGLLFLFFLSPISSAQLFEAAGIIRNIALKPLLVAFAVGRVISYSFYVSSASVLGSTSLGELIAREMTSPAAIALQVVLIVGLVALGNVKWKSEP